MSTRKSLKISLEIIIIFWICRLTTHLANVASCFPLCQFTQAPQFPTTTSPISSGFPKLPTPPGPFPSGLTSGVSPTSQASPFPTTTSPISSGFPKLPTPPGPFPSGLTSGVSPTSTSHSPSFPISNHHFSNFFRLPQTSNTTWSIPFRPYLRCLPNFHLPLPKLPHFQPPLLQFLQASPNFQHHLVHSLQAFTSGVSPTSTSHSPSFPISNHHFSNFFRLPQISNTTWSIPFRPYLRCLPNFHLPLPKLPHFQPPLLQFLQASPNFQHHLVHSLQALPQVSPQLPPPTPQASPFPTTTSPISSGFPKLPTPPGPFPFRPYLRCLPNFHLPLPQASPFPTTTSPISSGFPKLPTPPGPFPFRPYLRCLPNFHLSLPKLPHFQPPLLQFLQASPNFQHHLVYSLQASPTNSDC